ncbi:ras guanine nucleotide exchange factor domain-containing protein [Parasitella parasitica]|nr:ras guanine nucleotide exchange factor domain-containing protein [Parasitella parasitica]
MNSTLNYTNATQLLEQGKAKDAYAAFLSIVELSTQQLYGVKFVHQTIVSKPEEYNQSIALLRSSLDQLEKIAIHKLPGAITNINSSLQKVKPPPPPVPPKPSTINGKPTVPPKPSRIIPKIEDAKMTQQQKRTRGSSVSFAEDSKLLHMTIIENDEEEDRRNDTRSTELATDAEEEDDEEEEEDTVVEFGTNQTKPASPTPISPVKRPTTATFDEPSNMKPYARRRSQSWMVQSDTGSRRDSIDVLLETVVDPRNLVPAQTNTGDSISLPSSTETTSQTNYVPNIPAPPLLATHRRLQQRLNELETDPESISDRLPSRAERSHKAHCAKQTLEKVRTLYMSAMTIPSILQFSPQLIAYQLTLIESSIFRGIPPEALLSHSARTPHKKIVASTDFFNFITRSIEHSILLPQEASRRAEIIHRWIKIATKLLAINNYQTLKAVISALGTPPIQRLRRTWECIPKKRTGRLELLNTLMSETNNYCKYREHMRQEGKRLWTKPVVPFLGVYIHDVTYLYAAAKGNQRDSRVQDVLSCVQHFQRAPVYPQCPPPAFANVQKRHLFRPMLSDALHFGSSSKKSNNKAATAALMGDDEGQETEVELEQQLIVQYLLMRPWVSEKVIDALSNLREPPKSRSISSPTSSRYSSDSTVNLSITTSMANYGSGSTPKTVSPSTANAGNNSSSILGNASSFIRFSSSSSSSSNHHHPQNSEEGHADDENKKSIVGGFWPFRKSIDTSRSSVCTDDPPLWNEDYNDEEDDDDDEEDDDDDEEEDKEQDIQALIEEASKHALLNMRKRPSTMVNPSSRGHNRSISLPSKSIQVSELYHPS